MAPKTVLKKVEGTIESTCIEGDVVDDTTPHAIDSIKSWRQIFENLDYEIKNFPHDSKNNPRDIAESELHKIAGRPRLMPYNDMIYWALERLDVKTRSILDSRWVVIGSFKLKHIQVMYMLSPNPKYIYNAEFIAEFQRKECVEADQTYPDIIRDWWGVSAKFRADTHRKYPMASLNEYMVYVAMMLCRLFGNKIPTHFPTTSVPLIHEAVEGFSFNWDKILSDNLSKEVTEYQNAKSKGQPVAFYMSAYIMDAICFMTPFPLMNLNWNPTSNKPIHEYYSKLWEENAKDSFYEICHFVVIPVHQMFYGYEPPHISQSFMESLKGFVEWFIEENVS